MQSLHFKFIVLPLFLTITYSTSSYSDLSPPPDGETPASLACIYGLTSNVNGCPIQKTTLVPKTGSGAIAIIDGQDDPNAFSELQQFSGPPFNLHSLPQCNSNNSNQPCFQQYYVTLSSPACISVTDAQTAGKNASDYGINQATDVEPELDIEWAHAMAPYASIYMIETQGWGDDSNPNNPNISSLINGIQCATSLLQQYNNGKGIISYSHSFQEWQGELAYDSYFQTPGIIYIASSGDYSAPARYPATSPYVIAAGGTSIQRDASGNYIGQVAWNDTTSTDGKTGGSGGPSLYEPRPSYQNNIQKMVGTHRGTPDISFAAAGIDVFCCALLSPSNNCCDTGTSTGKPSCESVSTSLCTSGKAAWVTTGGTSLASPALAGIINSAHSGATSSFDELTTIYNGAIKNYHSYWTDIIAGNNGFPALAGYDFTTGLGVARGYNGK